MDERLVVSLDGKVYIDFVDHKNLSLLHGSAGLSVSATQIEIDDLAIYELQDAHGGIEDNLAMGNYDWKTFKGGAAQ